MNSKQAKEYLVRELREIINKNYIFLDLPYFLNIGDMLIWESTLDILVQVPQKCLYQASIDTYKKRDLPNDVIIVFMGGGNYGDLWYRHQKFRYRVMDDYPNNPIVQLPQSICFQDEQRLDYDIKRVLNHKGGFTFCLRDQASFDLVTTYYGGIKHLLLPDMVLSFDILAYCKKYSISLTSKDKVQCPLLVQRDDCEKSTLSIIQKIPANAIIGDWPTMSEIPFPYRLYKRIFGMVSRYKLFSNVNRFLIDIFFQKYFKFYCIQKGIEFIIPYEQIYSTRLHAAILAFLLGKQTYVIDNSYKKCSGVVDLWLDDQTNIRML